MGPHLLQQIAPLLGEKRLDHVLFGRQHPLKADHEETAEQVGEVLCKNGRFFRTMQSRNVLSSDWRTTLA